MGLRRWFSLEARLHRQHARAVKRERRKFEPGSDMYRSATAQIEGLRGMARHPDDPYGLKRAIRRDSRRARRERRNYRKGRWS